jgi:hypothetical protein
MIRFLQVNTAKNIPNVKAAAELKNGQPVAYNPAEGTVSAATGKCAYLVKAAETYNGINAVRMPSDGDYEHIPAGAICHLVPAYEGEHYATTEVTVGSLNAGDRVAATGGKFVANTAGEWIFNGEYTDPTGLTMYEIIYSPIAE